MWIKFFSSSKSMNNTCLVSSTKYIKRHKLKRGHDHDASRPNSAPSRYTINFNVFVLVKAGPTWQTLSTLLNRLNNDTIWFICFHYASFNWNIRVHTTLNVKSGPFLPSYHRIGEIIKESLTKTGHKRVAINKYFISRIINWNLLFFATCYPIKFPQFTLFQFHN